MVTPVSLHFWKIDGIGSLGFAIVNRSHLSEIKHYWRVDMDNAIVQTNTQDIAIAQEIKQLVSKGVSENTLRRYAFWQREIDAWRGERVLNDALMAVYITTLHQSGKSPSTISQAVAAVRWISKKQGGEVIGELTNGYRCVSIAQTNRLCYKRRDSNYEKIKSKTDTQACKRVLRGNGKTRAARPHT